jgi:hypothetical protein
MDPMCHPCGITPSALLITGLSLVRHSVEDDLSSILAAGRNANRKAVCLTPLVSDLPDNYFGNG